MKHDVLVVGSGMYVLGRNEDDFGTILPTLAIEQQKGTIGKIILCSSKAESSKNARKRTEVLGTRLGFHIGVECYPEKSDNPEEYIRVLENNKNIKLGVVSVPDHLHFPITKDLLKRKISCLVVKPFTTKLSEALELTKIAEENFLWGSVEFHKRFDRANLLMKDAIGKGKIGELLYFVVEYSQRRIIPEHIFAEWSHKTNIFQYLGVHYVDLIYFLTNARPVRACATHQQKLLKKTPDSIQANIEWKLSNGESFNSVIITNWIDPNTTSAMSDQAIKVIGTKGRIESDQKHRGLQLVNEKGIEEINPYFSKIFTNANGVVSVEGYGPSSIRQFISDASDASEGRPVSGYSASFKDSLVSTAVIEAVTASIDNNNSWIDIATHEFSELFQ
jgi:predicted dehydrogenase